MRSIRIIKPLVRLVGSGLLVATALSGGHIHARSVVAADSTTHVEAPAPRPLLATDFFGAYFGYAGSGIIANDSEQGTTYKLDILFAGMHDTISFDARNFPSYNALTFGLGGASAKAFDAASRLIVLGDGHTLASIQGTTATVKPMERSLLKGTISSLSCASQTSTTTELPGC